MQVGAQAGVQGLLEQDVAEELEGVQVGEGGARQEAAAGDQHEGDGQAALPQVQAGPDEAPELVEQQRRRQEHRRPERQPHQGEERLGQAGVGERLEHRGRGLVQGRAWAMAWALKTSMKGFLRPGHELEAEAVGDGERHHQDDQAADEARPQLVQVVPEGHLVVRTRGSASASVGSGLLLVLLVLGGFRRVVLDRIGEFPAGLLEFLDALAQGLAQFGSLEGPKKISRAMPIRSISPKPRLPMGDS